MSYQILRDPDEDPGEAERVYNETDVGGVVQVPQPDNERQRQEHGLAKRFGRAPRALWLEMVATKR